LVQLTESRGASIGNAADRCRGLQRPTRKRHFVAVDAGCVFLGDDVPVRVDLGVAENSGDPVFKTLGDEMFQPLGLLVHFVPGVLQNIMQEELEQTVMSHQFPCPSLPGRR
jgi:hypothetical protein